MGRLIDVKKYTEVDPEVLKGLQNPTREAYEIKIDAPEFTFIGRPNQPDYGHISIWFYPVEKVIELKSFKEYLTQYRNVVVSYERVTNQIYDHLMEIFKPARLRIEIVFRPRGGITSKIAIDSDWGVRGGTDSYWCKENRN
jgi:7-cyano-7-deazaguanine reductase